MTARPLHAELRTGPDPIESERIGTPESAGVQDGIFEFTFRLGFREFDWIKSIAVYLPDPAPELSPGELAKLAEARVAGFLPQLEKVFTTWFHRCVLWDKHVRSLDDVQFLRWLETQPEDLPRILSIPAVEERLIAIRNREPKRRKDAADAIARLLTGVASGRPKAPADVFLYHEVKAATAYLRPVYEFLRRVNQDPATDTSAWGRFKRQHRDLAEDITRMKLCDKWFPWGSYRDGTASAKARQSVRREDVSPLSLACEYVATTYRLSPVTVERRYEAVNARRKPKRIGRPRFRVKRTVR